MECTVVRAMDRYPNMCQGLNQILVVCLNIISLFSMLQALFCTCCMPCWNLELLGKQYNYTKLQDVDVDSQGQAC